MSIGDFLGLFDASGFLARSHCGQWTESLKLTYILSNGIIALAYALISCSLVTLWRHRRDALGSPGILLGFGGFIGACGLSHLCNVVVFWWPAYRLFTLVDALTALLSIGTAMAVPSGVQYLLRLPTTDEFRRINLELERACHLKEQAIGSLEETIRALRRQVGHLEQIRRMGRWAEEQETALRDLRATLDSTFPREGPT